jgi:AraC-like DNA-binding protein
MSMKRQTRPATSGAAGRELAVPPLRALPWPVVAHGRQMAPGEHFPPHVHGWNQLAFATDGVLQVSAAHARYVISPQQALWIPTGTLHHTRALGDASFRNLYVADVIAAGMPAQCMVLDVSPLLRALIIELDGTRADDDGPYYAALCAVIAAQLLRQPRHARHLPWPQDARLQRWCQALYDQPDDERPMQAWAAQLCVSTRTLARHFERETGMSVRAWRTRLRVLRAIEWLAQGRSPTVIAHALGYASASAFNYMFRVEMGGSPLQWRRSR